MARTRQTLTRGYLLDVLAEIQRLALEASEEYEPSCRSKVSRIYVLAKEAQR